MSNIALIYWLTRLSSISDFFLTLGVISAAIVGIGFLGYSMAVLDCWDDDRIAKYKVARKKFINKTWVPMLFFVLYILTPNTKEAILIVAGSKTLDYVQKDTSLQKIPYKATELVLKKMEEYIDETTSDSAKTK